MVRHLSNSEKTKVKVEIKRKNRVTRNSEKDNDFEVNTSKYVIFDPFNPGKISSTVSGMKFWKQKSRFVFFIKLSNRVNF